MKTTHENKGDVRQLNRPWCALLAGLLFAASINIVSADTVIVNTFDSSAEVANYGVAYGTANTFTDTPALSFSTDDANGSASSGSLEFVEEYGAGVNQGAYAYYFSPAITANLDEITNLQFDIKVDPASALDTSGNAAYFQLAFDDQSYGYHQFYANNITTNAANNGWVHVSVSNGGLPLSQLAGFTAINAIVLDPYDGNYTNVPGTEHTIMYIDNIKFLTSAAPPPPPTMYITPVSPGLHFVQGSISGEFDRQNIATAGTGNYTWAGVATGGNPVTYSFNILEDNGPDLDYHIYFYQTAGAGTASAPDYNQPNVAILQLQPTTNGTTIVTITWKTNSPSSGTITNAFFGSAISFTNSTILGNWQLQFTSNTGGSVIAPVSGSHPFTIDASVAASLANPITVNFGINPQVNTNSILGEDVVISQISVTGVDPLSANYPNTDNFLTDSLLDTNTWTVNAHNAASILFAPSNVVYSVNWTVPDTGFELQQNTNLTSSASWTDLGLPTVLLPPGVGLAAGKRTLIAKNNLPAGNSAFFRLLQRTASQLQVLLPGETNAPGTVSGKVGTPTSANADDFYTVTVNAVDSTFHIVNVSGDNIHLTTTDGGAITPSDASLANGTVQMTLEWGDGGGNFTVTASDTTNPGTITSGTSSSVTVLSGD
jgi:hypothetical protein